MRLHSEYGGSPEDEIEIWGRVIAPSNLPDTHDDETARREEDNLAGTEYQVAQTELDEATSVPPDIANLWSELSDPQREIVRRMIEDLTTE